MPQKDYKAPAGAFFDRLLSRQDPRSPVCDAGIRQGQLLCGRWLALRRLRLGLTLEALAEKTGLPLEALLFVELGLADEPLALGETACLSRLLSGPYGDDAWVAMVMAIALGRIQAPSDRIMRRVVADLEAVYHTI
jgi:transcriptional regulator with XRE-family HTH domain